jgi:alkanesulfonate monooxygenase
MSMEVLWTLGGESDGEFPWDETRRWRPDPRRILQVASAVDTLPFSGALMAIGVPGCFDPWSIAAAAAMVTTRMRFLIATYPGVVTPTQLALQALTLDHLSGGRVMLNVVGSNPFSMAAHGLHLDKDERYAMLTEYWNSFSTLYAGGAPTAGKYFDIENPHTLLGLPPVQSPHPPLWGAGGSPEGLGAVVPLVDTYLTGAGTPQEMASRTGAAREHAERIGIPVPSFGVSLGVLVRETEEEAWAAARHRLAHLPFDMFQGTLGYQAVMDADRSDLDDRQLRCLAAIDEGRLPDARDLEYYPNLWNGPIERVGVDVLRTLPMPNSMLIGSAEQVAERMREIQRVAGIDRFILWAPPFLEEAYRVADLLLPLLDLPDADSSARLLSAHHARSL